MPSDDKSDSFSPYAIVRKLDRVLLELENLKAKVPDQKKLDEVMFEVRAIQASLADQKKLNEDVVEMRGHYRLIKNLVAYVMAPAMVLIVGFVFAKLGVFSKPQQMAPAPWPGERLGSEQVPKPSTP